MKRISFELAQHRLLSSNSPLKSLGPRWWDERCWGPSLTLRVTPESKTKQKRKTLRTSAQACAPVLHAEVLAFHAHHAAHLMQARAHAFADAVAEGLFARRARHTP